MGRYTEGHWLAGAGGHIWGGTLRDYSGAGAGGIYGAICVVEEDG